ncbi:lysophospholipase [Malassezia psittaci]|uniref:Lysophospholipase n=1 Tax=Malassezia psittaci TaxID=1821823 RepID=A0AAF0FFX6_9BASI|nr:lysophospholipase [Malassezia psittaci]
MAVSQSAAFASEQNGRKVFSSNDLDAALPEDQRDVLRRTILEARVIENARKKVQRRTNPSGSYAPSEVSCPALPSSTNKNYTYTGYVRNALDNVIGPQEQDYLTRHRNSTRSGWQDWLSRAGLDGNGGVSGGVSEYLNNGNQPVVGFAVSGGGYRAMLHGMGVAQGFDGRNATSTQRGVGGLLQIADYFAGLSGGSWCTGAMAMSNWATAQDMLAFMNLEENLILPKDGKTSLYIDLFKDVDAKKNKGFPTAITDYWGRALSYHLLNGTTYPNQGQAATFSDIVNVTNFQQATYPFPVVLSIGRQPDELIVNPNATYFEWNPYEFGSWQPNFEAFAPTGYVGSNLMDGQVNSSDKQCVGGFENFGYVVGSSSTLFNSLYMQMLEDNETSVLDGIIESVLSDVSHESNDVARTPNPFKGYSTDASNFQNNFIAQDDIDLVDGGEANQNIPFEPLIQTARNVDLIIAIDGSSDTSGWPNGSSLYETEKRMNMSEFQNNKFPSVPDMNTIVNLGLNTRPTFFGCAAENSSADVAPLVVYMPSYPYSYWTNTSTYQLQYNTSDAQKFIDNSVDVATMGGAMSDWHTCLACATLQRGMIRSKTSYPDKCTSCFSKYCWNGTYNMTLPGNYTPPLGFPEFVTSQGKTQAEPPVTGSNTTQAGIGSLFGEHSAGSSWTETSHYGLAYAMATLIAAAFVVL